jgi:hypothetical protein
MDFSEEKSFQATQTNAQGLSGTKNGLQIRRTDRKPLSEPAVIIDHIIQHTPFPLQNFWRANQDPYALSAMSGLAKRQILLLYTLSTVFLLAKTERGLFREKLIAGLTIAVKTIFWKQ